MGNGQVPPHVWWLRMGRDILAVEVPPEEQGTPALQQSPQAKVLVSGGGPPQHLALKISEYSDC